MKLAKFFIPAVLGCSGVFLAPAGLAQPVEIVRPGGILPAGTVSPSEPADRLASSLRMLAQYPYDVSALTQAGESALAVGDANAAISFLARAEELSPANGRIKASLASALVLVERPADSFRLFNEALALGMSEQRIAKDRGLAYDLTGDQRRAQRDYSLALREGADDEVTRRLSLSLGISGDLDQSLRLLEPLLRRQDQAAWRARAFILAMNGDIRGAESIAEQVAPPAMVAGLATFMRRLAILTPAQRASAVNFGSMPGNQMQFASVPQAAPFRPMGGTGVSEIATVPTPASPAAESTAVTNGRGSAAPRRRPGRDSSLSQEVVTGQRSVDRPAQIPAPIAPVGPSWSSAPASRREAVKVAVIAPASRREAVKVAVIAPPSTQIARRVDPPPGPALFEIPAAPLTQPVKPPPAPAPVMVEPRPVAVTLAAVLPAAPPVPQPLPPPAVVPAEPRPVAKLPDAPVPVPGFSDMPALIAASPPPASAPVVEPVTSAIELVSPPAAPVPAPEPVTQATGLASIMVGIETEQESSGGPVLSDAEFRKARLVAKRKSSTEAAAALVADGEAKDAAERKRIASLQPERIWVQVATGSNRSGLGGTLARLREKAPDALKGVGGATVAFKATNRVLVGPFRSQAEARAVINKLSKQGVAATSWTSSLGQDVTKLSSR